MRSLNEIDMQSVSGGETISNPQQIEEFIREWNALHPNNPLPVAD